MDFLIETFRLEKFKKFSELNLKDLARINLIVGDNNVGKTTLLEAIFTFSCGNNFYPLLSVPFSQRLQDRRLPNPMILNPYRFAEYILYTFHWDELVPYDVFRLDFFGRVTQKSEDKISYRDMKIRHEFVPSQIFSEFIPQKNEIWYAAPTAYNTFDMQDNVGNNIKISLPNQYLGKWDIIVGDNQGKDEKKETFYVTYPNSPSFSDKTDKQSLQPLILAKFNNELSHCDETENRRIFAAITRAGIMDDFIKEINESFDIRLETIENIPYPDGSEASITFRLKDKNFYIPLYAFGDGLRRWYSLLGGMLIFRDAVLCIDEVDVGFHQQVQGLFSKQLVNYAHKYNNQLFMTTHNKEYMSEFLNAIDKMGNNVLENDVRVITLRAIKDSVKCRTLTGIEALRACKDGLDVRL